MSDRRNQIAELIAPHAMWGKEPTKRFVPTLIKHNWDQFYVWDTDHSSIVNPDGPRAVNYPWRRMETPEDSQKAADALNAKEDAWWVNAQAEALATADAILALPLEH